jgi:rRNA maturation endonuclease Nob1
MFIDQDGNAWENCQECGTPLPYPKSMCARCELRLKREREARRG